MRRPKWWMLVSHQIRRLTASYRAQSDRLNWVSPLSGSTMLLLFDHVCVQELKNLVLHIRVVKQAMFNL